MVTTPSLGRVCLILSNAFSVFSCVPNAVSRTKPSPRPPKPAPGVHTTFAECSIQSKNSHEVMPLGVLTHR